MFNLDNKIIIGKEEWCALPQLGLPAIKARIDSGAKTSSLHAFNIHTFDEEDKKYVHFDIHPIQDNRKIIQSCKALVVDQRNVKSSSGEKERRHVIKTPIKLGEQTWDIEVTLTNRDSMGYRMLIGRQAMKEKVLINPEASMCLGELDESIITKYYNTTLPKKKGLKIALLANNPDLYSNKRIIEAGEERGHEMRFINISQCYMNISSSDPSVYYIGGELLDDIDAIIPRIKPTMTFYGCAVARHFQYNGAFCLNDAVSIARTRDTLRSFQVLSNRKIPMPITGFATSPVDTADIINMVGGTPLIIKLLEGTQGKGVVLTKTRKTAESVINAFKSLNANILVQEYISESQGQKIRSFVIDGKVAGSIQGQDIKGESVSNIHSDEIYSNIKLTTEERKIVVNSAKAMGLKVAAIDIIRSNTGPKVIAINSSPALEKIEDISGKDIAGLMIECIERNVKYKKTSL
jgi:ribosomal protein S6--L-glutamate ligase